MLTKTIGLVIRDYKISMTSPLKFFEDDDLILCFQIGEFGASVINDDQETNLIFPKEAFLFVETSNGIDTVEPVTINGNEIYFRLTSKYTNVDNVGIGRMQIVLLDGDSRKALPPFQFEIQPIIYQEQPEIMYNGLMDEYGVSLCSEDMMLLDSTDPVYGIKISELPITDVAQGYIPIVQDFVTKKISVDTLINTTLNQVDDKIEGFATEEFVVNKIAEAQLTDKEIDLSGYATQSQLAEKADIVHTHSYNELTDTPTIPSLDGYATQEYVGGVVDANIIFDNDMNVVTGLGGIKAGDNLNGLTLKDVVNKLLFPYVAPTISASLTYSPSGSLFEYGQIVSIISVNGNVTKKSEAITSIKFLENSTVLNEITDGIGASGSYKHAFETPIQITTNLSNSRFRFSVTDATNKTYTCNTSGFSFCYPFYYGIVDENYSISNIINSLTKKIETKGTKAYTYTTNNQCMVIAYPKAYGTLTKITDPNNFDVTGTFAVSELIVNCLDDTNQAYYVYINNASTVSNFRLTFTF